MGVRTENLNYNVYCLSLFYIFCSVTLPIRNCLSFIYRGSEFNLICVFKGSL